MSDDQAPPLAATGVAKSYGRGAAAVSALRGVDLRLAAGEMVAVMGASGSGKSTLMHALAGLTAIDQGTIAIAGTDLATLDDAALTRFRRRRMGVVFQAYNLIPALDATANVLLPKTLDGAVGPAERERAEALLAEVGLAERRSHRPDQLSGGEQQRVAIARALIAEPALILADEPTGNLDSRASERICALLAGLRDQGRSLVVVTHEPAVARWADRVVVLADGLVADGFGRDEVADVQGLATRYLAAVDAAAPT